LNILGGAGCLLGRDVHGFRLGSFFDGAGVTFDEGEAIFGGFAGRDVN